MDDDLSLAPALQAIIEGRSLDPFAVLGRHRTASGDDGMGRQRRLRSAGAVMKGSSGSNFPVPGRGTKVWSRRILAVPARYGGGRLTLMSEVKG